MHARRAAVAVLENPAPATVQQFLGETHTLVVLGHDGPLDQVHSIRREADGGVWMVGQELGRQFPMRRLYLWACDTTGEGATRRLALADQARQAGAGPVAGHSVSLRADFDELGGPFAEHFRLALAQLVWGFVDLGDDAQQLQLKARQTFPLEIELDAGPQLDWFRRSQWLLDRISNFHIA
jgi:hypothetical protein